MTPQIIAIDGPDGAGKTTQIKLLADYLTDQGLDIHVTRASGGTPIGEELRKASLSMHPRRAETDVYISLAMHTELGYDIQKRKAAGQIVLIDRSPLAVLGYNMAGSQLADEQLALDACRTLLKLWGIDVMVYMDAAQDIMDERLRARGGSDYFESQGEDYRLRVKNGYERGLQLIQAETGIVGRLHKLDASQSVEAIHEELIKNVAR